MNAEEQEMAVEATADDHADRARHALRALADTPEQSSAVLIIADALLAIEARLNEITYRLWALER